MNIVFTNRPLEPRNVCLYVIEVTRLAEIRSIGGGGVFGVPVLSYGPPEELSAAWNAGCADYLKSPWTVTELHFRIDRLLLNPGGTFSIGHIELTDTEIVCGRNRHDLSAPERKILSSLIRHSGAVVPREALYYRIWGVAGTGSRVVDMHISRLRNKLKSLQRDLPPGEKVAIITVRGEGYCIR